MPDFHPVLDRHAVPSVAIVGNDAMLAASPATPVQLAHACLQWGFAVAIPASWGDELIAAYAARQLAAREKGPAVMCACPLVRARLLAPGPVLAPFLVSLVAPPVAVARYLRAVYPNGAVRLTYIGGCPGADDAAIDARITPDAFLAELAERGIALSELPLVFDSIVPPDRRRWSSLPGGVPTADVLWSDADRRSLVEVDRQDVSTELAEHIIAQEHALIDLAPALGCACSGATSVAADSRGARASITALEPPRALAPVIDASVSIALDLPLEPAGAPLPDGPPEAIEPLVEAALPTDLPEMVAATETPTSIPGNVPGIAPLEEPQVSIAETIDKEESATVALAYELVAARADERVAEPAVGTSAPEPVETPALGFVDVPLAFDTDHSESPNAPAAGASAQQEADAGLPDGERAAAVAETAGVGEATEVSETAQLDEIVDVDEGTYTDHGTEVAGSTPVASRSSLPDSKVSRRTPPAFPVRPNQASIPRTRAAAGRPLPRAYVAKRRTPPTGTTPVAAMPGDPTRTDVARTPDIATTHGDTEPSVPSVSAGPVSNLAVDTEPAGPPADNGAANARATASFESGSIVSGAAARSRVPPAADASPAQPMQAGAASHQESPVIREPAAAPTTSGTTRGLIIGLSVVALIALGVLVVWSLRP